MKLDGLTDSELVSLIKRKEDDWNAALEEVMRRYKSMLFSYIYGFTHDRHTSEDVLQEVFIRFFTKIGRFDPSKKLSTWLMRISHNLSIDYLRRRRETLSNEFPIIESAGDGANRGLSEEVCSLLSKVDADSRSILILRDSLGFDYNEISDLLDMPLGTVKSRIFRAREKFKSLWLESASRRGD